jgi:ABC-2 type transport system permease protein
MFTIIRKEFSTFFGSITGYLVVALFLLITSLFLWVFPGNYNLIDGQRASLKAFFDLAPWLYLFLIPAITMRMFAEEQRMGTIELLLTRPISQRQLVGGKFLAALLLVVLSLLPTLLYFFSVHQLGNPVGNIDTGATWGSFIGLLFLASVYIGIGLFASALTANQVISFLLATASSFVFFLGFDFAASSIPFLPVQNFLYNSGIQQHYLSISRGVIDSRDLFYFVLITTIFLFFTLIKISTYSLTKLLKKNAFILYSLILLMVLGGASYRIFRIDLTQEKRYSLSSTTRQLLQNQDQPLGIEVYLSGNLPAAMKGFQEAIIEKIEDLNAYAPVRIVHQITDVYSISSNDERNKIIGELINAGIQPFNFGHKTTEGMSTRQIFPGVIISNRKRALAVNLLKNNPMLGPDENLRQSTELLEYEFARAIRILQREEKPRIAFLDKEAGASRYETGDLRYSLSENYELVDRTARELSTDDSVKTLIIAAPELPFSEEEKLHIDQFIMRGGKTLWCIDPVSVSIDSLSVGLSTLAFEQGLNIRDQLFRYGVRINSDLVQDAFCLEYPINTAPPGQASSFTPAPFYYAPLAQAVASHPLSRNINNVLLEFTSSLEPVGNEIKGTPILTTSAYARSVQTPVEVSLLSATNPPDQALFNQAYITTGILLEGSFTSAFKNRMTSEYGIKSTIDQSKPSKMIVISDGDLIKNKVRERNGQPQILPLGYDQYSGQTFGNRDFLVNCVDYLNDDSGMMQIRSKVVKLRMLDKVKLRDEQIKWQLINTLLPQLFILLFSVLFAMYRKHRYGKTVRNQRSADSK